MARQMKSSGVEWIGDIPEKWDVCKIINCLSSIGSGTTPQGQEYYENEYIPWLNTGDLNDGYIEKTEKSVSEKALSDYSVLKRFDAGSVVVAMYGATVGKLGIVTSSLVTNQACCVMTSNEKLYNKFLFYLFMAGKTYLISLSLGSGQPNINQNTVKTFDIPFVPLSEQKEIADYLDDRCGKIDDFIAKQKTVIEKLKEYKQSVITEAVTKGLAPAAPMKSSGVDWIGDIPEKWEVQRLKTLLSKPLQYGANAAGVEYNKNLPRYIRITDISTDNKLRENDPQSLPLDIATPFLLENGDILFARSGATVGKTFQFKICYGKAAFAGYLIRAQLKNKISSSFVYYYTLSFAYDEWKNRIFIQSTIQNIGANKYSNLEIPYPPLSEQKEIADYLDAKCAEIDAFIAKKQVVIDKLTEYKKSLIYECVTGKREVA